MMPPHPNPCPKSNPNPSLTVTITISVTLILTPTSALAMSLTEPITLALAHTCVGRTDAASAGPLITRWVPSCISKKSIFVSACVRGWVRCHRGRVELRCSIPPIVGRESAPIEQCTHQDMVPCSRGILSGDDAYSVGRGHDLEGRVGHPLWTCIPITGLGYGSGRPLHMHGQLRHAERGSPALRRTYQGTVHLLDLKSATTSIPPSQLHTPSPPPLTGPKVSPKNCPQTPVQVCLSRLLPPRSLSSKPVAPAQKQPVWLTPQSSVWISVPALGPLELSLVCTLLHWPFPSSH